MHDDFGMLSNCEAQSMATSLERILHLSVKKPYRLPQATLTPDSYAAEGSLQALDALGQIL